MPQEELEKAQESVEIPRFLMEKLQKERSYSKILSKFLKNSIFLHIQKLQDHVFFFVVESNSIRKFMCEKEFLSVGTKINILLKLQQWGVGKPRFYHTENEFEKLSRRWYEILPPQLRTLFQENDCIIFSPDHHCSLFPLETLQTDGQPLCVEKTVVRATSIHQFSNLLTKKPSFDSSSIIGNPWPQCTEEMLVYNLPSNSNPFKISFLRGAEEEARTLEKKLPGSLLLSEQNATGERFLSEISRHPLIHFCGHGSRGRILFLSGPFKGFPPQFEPEEFSGLWKAERREGVKDINMMTEWHPVTDLDLFDIPLKDGAVVFLNACDTGQLEYTARGYNQGLSEVFLKNGAHSVISSLIPIFDEHSKEFALHFYDILLQTHSVAKSLREARIWAKNEYKAHIYWIPYIHYGSPL